MLQQYLPLAVLKLPLINSNLVSPAKVATVLTACGIETQEWQHRYQYRQMNPLQQYLPLAVLKLSGIYPIFLRISSVATVLTACGIET